MRKLLPAFLLSGCATVAPYAREVPAPTSARELAQETWSALGAVGNPPRTVFVKHECEHGFYDNNGLGCVRGEYVNGRVYVASIATWRDTLRHELMHAFLGGDPEHRAPGRWLRDGAYIYAIIAGALPR